MNWVKEMSNQDEYGKQTCLSFPAEQLSVAAAKKECELQLFLILFVRQLKWIALYIVLTAAVPLV